MKTVGLITEYNPFHNGHLYHLEISKKITSSDFSIAVMSGNFLQRGEPAIVDKWTRASMAVDNGVDLVIELPVIYACQSAEFFAYGAVSLLNRLGIIDSICFGSEVGDIGILKAIATVLVNEPKEYKAHLKFSLDEGNSFPKAREYALTSYLKSTNLIDSQGLIDILTNPNNILAIEYIKALIKINSSIIPYTIKRKIANYHNKTLTGKISSATAIREEILRSSDIESVKNTFPFSTYSNIKKYLNSYRQFNCLDNYSQVITYLVRKFGESKLKDILDIEDGLERRFINCAENNISVSDLIKCVSTKRYTNSRLKRILIHLLIDLNRTTFMYLNHYGPQYARILAANENGLYLLKQIKRKNTIEIITKFADYKKLENPILNQMIEFDKKATDIYFLGLSNEKSLSNFDYHISPYIKSSL